MAQIIEPKVALPADRGLPGRRVRAVAANNPFLPIACLSLLTLLFITAFLLREGLPIFNEYPVTKFLFGKDWYPTDEKNPDFGAFLLIVGSLIVTLVSSLIALPIGTAAAIYLSEVADSRLREMLKVVIELLAGIPSVVFGFFGLTVAAPWLLETFELDTGLTALTASLILALMAVPTITSIADDALRAVPQGLREASYALGATRWQTAARVVVPAGTSGIFTAAMLGMGRAFGETMTVLMVAGGAALIPSLPTEFPPLAQFSRFIATLIEPLLRPVRPITATIAAEMGEAPVGGAHYHALFALGIILFFITLGFNLAASIVSYRVKRRHEGR
ncbi:MAG TPA: phosphate ABC transporter permease subunit PstC [Blastocatellia bacterium]|nr:phosphate ABC transporter permease subunit PstC [Blastocatellia bacterium]